MEYEINIKEVLERVVTVEAQSKEEALRIIRKAYDEGAIVLDWDDLKETAIQMGNQGV